MIYTVNNHRQSLRHHNEPNRVHPDHGRPINYVVYCRFYYGFCGEPLPMVLMIYRVSVLQYIYEAISRNL